MSNIKLVLPIEPKGQMRPRFTRIGKYHKAYKHKIQKAEEAKLLGLLYEHKPPHPLEGALELKVVAHMPVPKSWPKWKQRAALDGEIRPAKKPDWDNIGKQICDVFNGVFWNDDAQIVGAMVRKHYSDRPRWEIEIREAE